MKKLLALALLAVGMGLGFHDAFAPAQTAAPAATVPARSSYGGCLDVKGKKMGFFHTEKIGGRWWMVDPDGYGYLGCGMGGSINYPGSGRGATTLDPETRKLLTDKYPTREGYHDAQVNRLLSWGFNFAHSPSMSASTTQPAAAWLPYAPIVNVGGTDALKDVFDEAFTERIRTMAARSCAPQKDNPRLIGYFTGNELAWNVFWGGSHVEYYLNLPATAGGRKVVAEFLTKRYASVDAFNQAWDTNLKSMDELATGTVKAGPRYDRLKMTADRDAFLFLMSKQFYGMLYREIKAADPNHMLMGSRFLTGYTPLAIARGMKGNIDVVSSNAYLVHRWPTFFDDFSREADAPIVITEFGYRAFDNGIAINESGAIPRVVQTDQDRGNGYAWYVSHMGTVPYLVGTTWWWYPDSYNGGSGVGTGNYGFINYKDEPYQALVAAASRANAKVYPAARAGKTLVRQPEVEYAVDRCAPLKLDGSADKYGQLDIEIDYRNAYEGYDFQKSGLAAQAAVRHDGKNIYLAVHVKDADFKRYEISGIAAPTTVPATTIPGTATQTSRPAAAEQPISPWQIDGVEFWLDHYQGVLYFDGDKAMANIVSGDIPEMEVAGKVTADGYFFEIKVPILYIADALKDGKLKLAIGINDGQRGLRLRQIAWPITYEWQYPDTFANGTLAK